MSVVILVPVLGRPDNVRPLIDSLAAATPERDWWVLFITDPDDHEEIAAIKAEGASFIVVGGTYAEKINAGISVTDDPLIFLGADDLRFHDGWLPAAAELISDTIGVVGTDDLGNRHVMAGEHATHSLVARWYAELGAIDGGGLLHEGYRHQFVDDELVGTAKHRGAWAFAADSIVEHLHPDWAKGETDATYVKGRASWRQDRRYFHRVRRPLWTSP